MTLSKVLILHAPGTNRDGDLAEAIRLAGGDPEIVPLSRLRKNGKQWRDYAMLALPGGFSYGDALGAGRLWALELQTAFEDLLQNFTESNRPVIGICNGFQVLVKAGILPGNGQTATLTFNALGHFECRWVTLITNTLNSSPWFTNLPPIHCPVAHGEGRFLLAEEQNLYQEQIGFTYVHPDGSPAQMEYPINPNGSPLDIAGVTNPDGNVLGMMPHPEDHIHPYQHPNWTRSFGNGRGEIGGMGVKLFENGLKMA